MKFLVKRNGTKGYLKSAAHLWLGSDTACRMASTGGIDVSKYEVSTENHGRRICKMCQNNHGSKVLDGGFSLT